MQTLKLGSRDVVVARWQQFLVGRGNKLTVTGVFDTPTEQATKKFQKQEGQIADGVVGNRTLQAALVLGFDLVHFEPEPGSTLSGKSDSQAWPLCLAGLSAPTAASNTKLFGTFKYEPKPTPGNPEAIVVDTEWVKANIVTVEVEEPEGGKTRKLRFHKLVAPHFEKLYAAWGEEGLLGFIMSWDGSYVARYIRGSTTKLSNHAYGSAFDINAQYNKLGAMPAQRDAVGSVRELVPLANKHGFYWGGHYANRKDGMHFEFVGVPK